MLEAVLYSARWPACAVLCGYVAAYFNQLIMPGWPRPLPSADNLPTSSAARCSCCFLLSTDLHEPGPSCSDAVLGASTAATHSQVQCLRRKGFREKHHQTVPDVSNTIWIKLPRQQSVQAAAIMRSSRIAAATTQRPQHQGFDPYEARCLSANVQLSLAGAQQKQQATLNSHGCSFPNGSPAHTFGLRSVQQQTPAKAPILAASLARHISHQEHTQWTACFTALAA